MCVFLAVWYVLAGVCCVFEAYVFTHASICVFGGDYVYLGTGAFVGLNLWCGQVDV